MLSEQQQRIMGYFIEEAKDHLNTIEQGLLSLQSTIADPELVSEVFRAAHSVKGGAAMLGLNSIQTTSHRLEDYFKILKECPLQINQTVENLFLSVFDALKEQLEQLQGPFGLTEDKAAEIMAGVEPVFEALGQHLSELVAVSGGVTPEDVELTPAKAQTVPVTASPVVTVSTHEESSALQLIFQSDIPVRLREMLQLFKQRDGIDSREQLQEVCQDMAQLGEPFELPEWTMLLTLAAEAIANTNNTYRALAPILIKEIKQAQELVLSGRSTAIVPSDALMTLVPDEPMEYPEDLTDFVVTNEFDASGTISPYQNDLAMPAADHPFQQDEALTASDSTVLDELDALPLFETFVQTDDINFSISASESGTQSGDEDIADAAIPATPHQVSELEVLLNHQPFPDALEHELNGEPATEHHGPEVGMAELNSLADLFEGEMPDLGTTWQEEEVIGLTQDGQIDLSAIEDDNDLSDFLFDQDTLEDLALETDDDEDLSGLLINVDQLSAAASAPVETFDAAPFSLSLDTDSPGSTPSEPLSYGNADDSELLADLFPPTDASSITDASASLPQISTDPLASAGFDGFEQLFMGISESSFSENSTDLPNDLFLSDAEVIDSDPGHEGEFSLEDLLGPEVIGQSNLLSDSAARDADLSNAPAENVSSQTLDDFVLGELTTEDEALISDLYALRDDEPIDLRASGTDASPELATISDPWGTSGSISDAALAGGSPERPDDLDMYSGLWDELDLSNEDGSQSSSSNDPSSIDVEDLIAEEMSSPLASEEEEEAFDFSQFDSYIGTVDISAAEQRAASIDLEAEESSTLDDLFGEQQVNVTDSNFLSDALNFDQPPALGASPANLFEDDLNGPTLEDNLAALFEENQFEANLLEASGNLFDKPQDTALTDADPGEDLHSKEPLELEAVFPEPILNQDSQTQESIASAVPIEQTVDSSVDLEAPNLLEQPEPTAAGNDLRDDEVEDGEELALVSDQPMAMDALPNEDVSTEIRWNELSDSEAAFTADGEAESLVELNTSLDSIGFTDWLPQDSLPDSVDIEDAFDLSDAMDLSLSETISALDGSLSESTSLQDWDEVEALMQGTDDTPAVGSEDLSGVSEDDDFADLDALLNEPAQTQTEAGFDPDFADLDALLAQPAAVAPSAPQTSLAVVADDFDDLEKLLENADKTLGGSPTGRGTALSNARRPNRRSAIALSDQTMRVSVKNLDNLNNLVGELVVNRNSLEQAEDRLRQFLDNLLYQVQQLSDVGQRMRDLYERSLLESSLLSNRRSYQLTSQPYIPPPPSNHATGHSFDALEMDRFTGFHTLSQEMIELIVRVRESSSDIDFVVDETDQITRNFRQITTQLQEGLTRSRMVPFTQAADRLPRAVRDISMKCGKQAELVIEGHDTLIDKMILEQLYDPMTHLVNNAITHGVETPEERQSAGKSAVGKITVRTFHQGNQTVISVMDDGAGIDPERVKAKAIAKGVITPQEAQDMTRLDVYDLLFHHGFSTRDKADDFAGRGVGLDVVRTSLNDIRGVVSIDSAIGRGTTFTIRLPLTLSISKALCCISNRARIAFPMDGVEDMLDIPRERVQRDEQDRPCIQWHDTLLPFSPLSDLLRYNRSLGRGSVYGGNQEDDIISVVVLRTAGNFLALQVDQVLGEQEIVIKQLEGPVPKPMGIAGATVLGDGRIMPIADVLELIDLSMGRVRREAGGSLWEKDDAQGPTVPIDQKHEPTVLIVDDSITVRELLSMTFNKVGYRVEQARDGQEAWEKLRSGLPCDLVFCDIEMPRMDGLELLSRIQKDPTLAHMPIAMLTSRGADRHRQMAVQLGAKGYFTKPYLEEALLDAAQRMLNGEVLVNANV